jgi:excisionase family DNA binding protein
MSVKWHNRPVTTDTTEAQPQVPWPDDQPLMTVPQVSKAIHMARETVRALIDSGQLPALSTGGQARIPTSAVRKLVGLPVDRIEPGA